MKKNNITPGTIIKINSFNKYDNALAKLEKNLINKKEFSELFLMEAKNLNIKDKLDVNEILNCLNVELEPKHGRYFFQTKKNLCCLI